MNKTENIKQTITHFNENIQHIAQSITKDIKLIDKAIIDSKILHNTYRVVDL